MSPVTSDKMPAWKRAALVVTRTLDALVSVALIVPACLLAIISRALPRKVDVGLGPEPLINNPYHKRALEAYGYSAETFVDQVYFITSEFDYRADLAIAKPFYFLRGHWLFARALFRYRALYIYFNGGPLMGRPVIWRLEPMLYRLAGIRTVVMPYGSDVQDLSRSPNLHFRHAVNADYPTYRAKRNKVVAQVDLWSRWATHVVSGCEWVDYMYGWDTLMLAHFSFDLAFCEFVGADPDVAARPLRLLHAPNHRAVKGTQHFVRAVEELQAEGVNVELELIERAPNSEIRAAIARSDVILDQLVIGWYAMFAIEAMATGKVVVCHIRPDLRELYEDTGLIEPGEMPIVDCSAQTVKDTIRRLAADRSDFERLGALGRSYVERHHSIEVIGGVFDSINRSVGVTPRTERG